jgi:uncharacterized caspase-like protein
MITPAETDKLHLKQALTAMKTAIGPNDEFVFYAATHGVVNEGEYYLVTSNASPSDAAHLKTDALSGQELTGLLINIAAARKLVVVDTCQSQAVGDALELAFLNRGVTPQTTVTILGRDNGFTVLAATTTDQEAIEGYNKHGLFTSVLADGLAGKDGSLVKAVVNSDGTVNTSGLAYYVKTEVPYLASKLDPRHPQNPTGESNGPDFPITKVR